MVRTIKTAFGLFIFFTLLTGLAYPLLVTGAAQILFPRQANGSLLPAIDGVPAGSELIGQPFNEPQYFWGRLSATVDHPYNAAASGASNYSALNENLQEQTKIRIAALRTADPDNHAPVPVDLVTASASGLDPHISPAAAFFQAPRVARARGLNEKQIEELIQQHIETPFLGIFGEARVNILLLNLALNSLQ